MAMRRQRTARTSGNVGPNGEVGGLRPERGRNLMETQHGRLDAGMSTVEYALGTLAAAAFALGLMRILTSSRVEALLSGVIEHALNKPF